MIGEKNLSGGGDIALKTMLKNSAMLGIDVIELLWTPRNRLPHMAVIDVVGYKFPRMTANTNIFDEDTPDSEWIDGTLKFYPDDSGYCWGYVYDTEENRELLATSLANRWFKIVDKRVREEIVSLAESKGYPTKPAPLAQLVVKKSVNEKKYQETIKAAEIEKEKMLERIRELEESIKYKTGEKAKLTNRRLKGIKVEEPEEEEDK